MSILLEDFLPIYPNFHTDGNIQNIITMKREFAELEARIKEPTPKKGSYYIHQKFFARMVRATDRIFNIQQTGTGKSCAFIGAAEMLMMEGGYKHTFILEKGKATIYEMKQQIICKCTDGSYETEKIKQASTSKSRKNLISREIGEFYTIETYHNFASRVDGMSDEQIIEEFSGYIFVVDEAHNIIGSSDEDKDRKDKIVIYNAIWRVFHLVQRCKIFVVTATPMINEVNEIAPMLNLVLPRDHQLPTDWDYRYVTLDQMEPYFRGLVTYVKSLETGAIPIYDGQVTPNVFHEIKLPPPDWDAPPIVNGQKQEYPELITKQYPSQMILHNSKMGDIQNYYYQQYKNDTSTVFHLLARQASCFVFPDGSIGGKIHGVKEDSNGLEADYNIGAGKYIKAINEDKHELVTPNDFYEWQFNPKRLTFKDWIRNDMNINNLARLSGKYAEIISIEFNNKGCSFIYSEFLNGSGAIILSLCLEAFGFEKFDETQSVFTSTGASDSICSSESRIMKSTYKKKFRYAMLNSNVPETRRSALLELFNSPENVDGEYIKIIIGTEVARDGINLFHCLRMHMAMAGWHPSGMIQAIARIIRAVSHDLLIARLYQKLLSEGKSEEEARALSIIYVKIYDHCAVSLDQEGSSIDRYIYLEKAEVKDIYIKRIMRMAKQCAVDCRINYNRNVKGDLVDYSAECDYDVCKYNCWSANTPIDIKSSNMDFSTYDILYSEDVIEACIIEILKLVEVRESVTFIELIDIYVKTGIFRETFIYQAVSKILERKMRIRNRFGFSCYIVTDGFTIYMQRDYPFETQENNIFKDLTYYNNETIAIKVDSFKEISYDMTLKSYDNYINELGKISNLNTTEGKNQLNAILKKMPFDFKMGLLESAISQYINSPQSALAVAIVDKFKNFIYATNENQDQLEEIAQKLNTRGRKSIKNTPASPSANGNVVYLHIYQTLDTESGKYNRVNNFFNPENIRVLNIADKLGWRNVLPYEKPIYKDNIINSQKKLKDQFDKFPDYGLFLDDIFHIVNVSNNREDEKDQRFKAKGKECSGYRMEEVIRFLVFNNVYPPNASDPVPFNSYNDLKAYLLREHSKFMSKMDELNKLTEIQLQLAYKWHQNIGKDVMCTYLQRYYLDNGKMMII